MALSEEGINSIVPYTQTVENSLSLWIKEQFKNIVKKALHSAITSDELVFLASYWVFLRGKEYLLGKGCGEFDTSTLPENQPKTILLILMQEAVIKYNSGYKSPDDFVELADEFNRQNYRFTNPPVWLNKEC